MTLTETPVGQGIYDTQMACADRTPDSPCAHRLSDTHMPCAHTDPDCPCARSRPDAHMLSAHTGPERLPAQSPPDTHLESDQADPTVPPAIHRLHPKGYLPADPSSSSTKPEPDAIAPTSTGQPGHGGNDTQNPLAGPILADPVLGLLADAVDDLETVRIANANRLRQLTDTGENGHGLPEDHPYALRLRKLVDGLDTAEHDAVLALQRAMRDHPLGAWVKSTAGVGEKQAARLLAVVRDPYWNDQFDRPRLVSELWAYCGFHVIHPGRQDVTGTPEDRAAGVPTHPAGHTSTDTHSRCAGGVAPKKMRGRKANWNQDARMRVWLIATSCIKSAQAPYRAVYDAGRLKYADATHSAPCVRCGPAGKPAAAGTPLSAGHQHARAVRLMCKEILRDLWREAARLHQAPEVIP